LPFDDPAGVGEGLSAAHKKIRLLLLPSGPDKVHGILLRRTQTMPTEPSKGNLTAYDYILYVFYRQ